MSLINDALKRATRNQPTTAAVPAPEPVAPMQPVEYRRRGLPWYFFPALLAILAVACWFIVKGVQARRQATDPASSPILVKAREPKAETPAPSAAPAPIVEAPVATPPAALSTPTPSPTTTQPAPTATEASATPPSPAPEPIEAPKPAFKLQGIFFRPANPSAMVNGRSVWVGSRFDGATVKTITRESLTIEVNGQTQVLTLD